jgi:uncharacterized membrane protein (DUF485 family)
MKHTGGILFGVGVSMLLPLTPAHAYLDAGSVSMAFQVAIGAVASALMFGKIYFRKVVALFSRLPARRDEKDNQA